MKKMINDFNIRKEILKFIIILHTYLNKEIERFSEIAKETKKPWLLVKTTGNHI